MKVIEQYGNLLHSSSKLNQKKISTNMKFSYFALLSVIFAASTYAAPIAQAHVNEIADEMVRGTSGANKWQRWARFSKWYFTHPNHLYKRDADASATAEANANAEAWRWHVWFRNQAIYKREESEDEESPALTLESENDEEEPLGVAYAFSNDTDSAEPIAFYPIYASDIDSQIQGAGLPSNSTSPDRIEKREADADADAWRWHVWFRNQAIYKREADAEAEADANPDAWRWHVWFRNQAIYKREADAEAEADANPDAWRWHVWFRNQAIY